ncbi:zinc-dependent metalloprotease [Chryseobacterium sp. CT-SW4]|uniref:zinc-dependent metalloprotease n=1 Tax=Chryseobacterium sp. SW-1 TaxID=3157343 RepID=UPI003B02DDFC
MKTIFTFLALFSVMNIYSQSSHPYCGFDSKMQMLDRKYPELKKRREESEAKLRNVNQKSYLNKVGATTTNALYTGQIYEIPVVVHVIESQAPANANLAVTDQEIKDWIDRANKMYATTYGNGFYPEGPGPDGGTVIPFKLVLAKRSPTCTATTGIVRYNGSTLPLYDTHGVASENTGNGVPDDDIKTLAPHWPENSYFNIYLVIGFNGQQQLPDGLMGYATFPETHDMDYESFMKVATIKNQNDTTLTHELGHAFGLYHTFEGVDYLDQTSCPVNNDCTVDGDRICDTSPSKSMFGVPVPNNSAIDPCTGQNYDGTQYNIMNYTNEVRKFTEGQRTRAVLLMMQNRKNLLNSLAAKDLSVVVTSPVSITAAQCNPAGTAHPANNNYQVGPYKVIFGDINSMTTGYDSDEPAPLFYADYSTASCIRPAYYTDIPSNTSTQLRVSYINGFPQAEKFKIKVWIDYNNNGSFESGELVLNSTSSTVNSATARTTLKNITPPASAVKNTYLRMRVAVDAATYNGVTLPDYTACSQLQYGQMEDYAVRINSTLGTIETANTAENKVVYVKEENLLKLAGGKTEKFGDYQIYDMSGKLIQRGNAKTNEIQIQAKLPKGTYILNYSNNEKTSSTKFLNN